MALYDRIGRSYRRTRRPDPRVAAAIRDALGDVGSVLNIGAGAGAYEPPQTVLAVEPSRVMIERRRHARHPRARTTRSGAATPWRRSPEPRASTAGGVPSGRGTGTPSRFRT
jgi:hypothetical protein